jgi:hypothetical protein
MKKARYEKLLDQFIEETLKQVGERCPDYNDSCMCCRIWHCIDVLKYYIQDMPYEDAEEGGEDEV